MSEIRPVAACLGDSADADFPLVLVLGREYNGSGSLRPHVGRYCFSESPHSAFWNRTYSLLSRACQVTGFKSLCLKSGLSPVVFSNLMPQPIPNELPAVQKSRIRSGIPESQVRSHIQSLFGLPIARRFQAVLLSVGDHPAFTSAIERVQAECADRELPLIEVPYLGSRIGNDVVDAALDRHGAVALCSVVDAFVSTQEA